MILSRLATFPARPRPFTELTALERIDTKETEIGCNRVAIERESGCGKPRLIDGSTPDVACGDQEKETQKTIQSLHMTKVADLFHCVDHEDQYQGNPSNVNVH